MTMRRVRYMGDVEILGDPSAGYSSIGVWGAGGISGSDPLQVRRVPYMLGDVRILGDLEATKGRLPRTGEIGWQWDDESGTLCAYACLGGKCVKVKIPFQRVKRVFREALMNSGLDARIVDETPQVGFLGGFVKSIGRAVRGIGRGIGSTARGVANFAKRKLGPIVKKAGTVALKVARSKPFAAVMGAMSVAPPLTAVGAAGLAAHSVAATAGKVIDTANDVRRGVKTVSRVGRAASRNPAKAAALAAGMASRARQLPNNRQGRMLKSALQSVRSRSAPAPAHQARALPGRIDPRLQARRQAHQRAMQLMSRFR